MRSDLYETITQAVITAIESGRGSAKRFMPWHRNSCITMPHNAASGRHYRGINTLLLWAAASSAEYPTGEWATYRQWSTLSAQVRKGECATIVLLWQTVDAGEDEREVDVDRHRRGTVARAFHVFNAAQVDSYTPIRTELPPAARIERAEAFFRSQPAHVWHGADGAFFDPVSDTVSLPSFGAFACAESYYSVYAHELTHWTGAKRRLDRDLSGRFGSAAYAMEELVAEIGAAFAVGHLGLAAMPRDDHASYIASWLTVLRNDTRAIITAASKAQAAADYLIGLAGPRPPAAVRAVAQ